MSEREPHTYSLAAATHSKLVELAERATKLTGVRLWPGNVIDALTAAATPDQVVAWFAARAREDGATKGKKGDGPASEG